MSVVVLEFLKEIKKMYSIQRINENDNDRTRKMQTNAEYPCDFVRERIIRIRSLEPRVDKYLEDLFKSPMKPKISISSNLLSFDNKFVGRKNLQGKFKF